MDAYAIYEGIIRGTNSELILFFVILFSTVSDDTTSIAKRPQR